MKRLKLTTFVSLLLLAGCGQKGPLFMPEPAAQNKPAQTQAPQPQSTREQEQN
ncbi:lipoprotein [Lacimicrobium sp. SS2-24]|uniref:LPS translocon maturation chaperone LptM n=1 Tax=Lacimicrobium sp. SS2-24 TaxID=2005569 RepID=UPI001FEEFD1D|nr:lipoprotein [Lacimicrobium sp. SS2-24]